MLGHVFLTVMFSSMLAFLFSHSIVSRLSTMLMFKNAKSDNLKRCVDVDLVEK